MSYAQGHANPACALYLVAAPLAISWLTNAIVLGVVDALVASVHAKNAGSLLAAAAVFGC